MNSLLKLVFLIVMSSGIVSQLPDCDQEFWSLGQHLISCLNDKWLGSDYNRYKVEAGKKPSLGFLRRACCKDYEHMCLYDKLSRIHCTKNKTIEAQTEHEFNDMMSTDCTSADLDVRSDTWPEFCKKVKSYEVADDVCKKHLPCSGFSVKL